MRSWLSGVPISWDKARVTRSVSMAVPPVRLAGPAPATNARTAGAGGPAARAQDGKPAGRPSRIPSFVTAVVQYSLHPGREAVQIGTIRSVYTPTTFVRYMDSCHASFAFRFVRPPERLADHVVPGLPGRRRQCAGGPVRGRLGRGHFRIPAVQRPARTAGARRLQAHHHGQHDLPGGFAPGKLRPDRHGPPAGTHA